MHIAVPRKLMLPSLGPLFPTPSAAYEEVSSSSSSSSSSVAPPSKAQSSLSESPSTSPAPSPSPSQSMSQSPPPRDGSLLAFQYAHNLRTPTSVHGVPSFHGAFAMSSPVKKTFRKPSGLKDLASFEAFTLDARMAAMLSASSSSSSSSSSVSFSSPPLSVSSASSTGVSTYGYSGMASPTDVAGSMSPSPPHADEDEKLRMSRERNRLHAQRTRIRKRELLESLKDRITGLQSEYAQLKHVYDSHVTAVYLLSMGDAEALRTVQGFEDPMVEALNVAHAVCVNDEDVDAAAAASGQTSLILHDKSCAYYHADPEEDGSALEDASCTCLERKTTTTHLDAHEASSKRASHPSPSSTVSLLACSKEEREQVRRERNRLHARRARLRKKLMLEKSQQAVQQLHSRNDALRVRLNILLNSIYDGRQPLLPTAMEIETP